MKCGEMVIKFGEGISAFVMEGGLVKNFQLRFFRFLILLYSVKKGYILRYEHRINIKGC